MPAVHKICTFGQIGAVREHAATDTKAEKGKTHGRKQTFPGECIRIPAKQVRKSLPPHRAM